MSLTLGLDIAKSGIATSAERTSVISRNIAGAEDPNATRKNANVHTLLTGGVHVAAITRTTDPQLLENVLDATSSYQSDSIIAKALDRIDLTADDPELDRSPAAMLAKFSAAVQAYASGPNDTILASAALNAAKDLSQALNESANLVADVRREADADLAESVETLNQNLARFEEVNNSIKTGTFSGRDVTDLLDQRDALLKSISEQVDIRTITDGDNGMAIFTTGGVTLFETSARSVSFTASPFLASGGVGQPVYVDGVAITGPSAQGGSGEGRIAGLAQVRDNYAPQYLQQLDEMARGLIEAFAESDQSAVPTQPDQAGLFTYSGAPVIPATGTVVSGLALEITVNPNVDPTQGGNLALLRDGGISDPGNPAYNYNSDGGAGFSDRLHQLIDKIDENRSFDASAGVSTSASLLEFAAGSVSWLQEARQDATNESEYTQVLLERSSTALSNSVGISLDEEMTILLELERSYQASSRIISVIDQMFEALFAAAG